MSLLRRYCVVYLSDLWDVGHRNTIVGHTPPLYPKVLGLSRSWPVWSDEQTMWRHELRIPCCGHDARTLVSARSEYNSILRLLHDCIYSYNLVEPNCVKSFYFRSTHVGWQLRPTTHRFCSESRATSVARDSAHRFRRCFTSLGNTDRWVEATEANCLRETV